MQVTEKQVQDIRVSDYQLTCVGHARKQYICKTGDKTWEKKISL